MRNQVRFPKLILLASVASLELARARILLSFIGPREVLRTNERAAQSKARSLDEAGDERDLRLCREMVFAITATARRVPWRSDCLVQALAGQNWLRRSGIASEIVVGTAQSDPGGFEAHAWLARDGEVLLGGEIARFQTLLQSDSSVVEQR